MSSGCPSSPVAGWEAHFLLMFAQLQQLIPSLKPLRMSGSDVDKYHTTGLTRSASYLNDLKSALEHQEYPLFTDAIQEILKYGVTIEQEVFLYL